MGIGSHADTICCPGRPAVMKYTPELLSLVPMSVCADATASQTACARGHVAIKAHFSIHMDVLIFVLNLLNYINIRTVTQSQWVHRFCTFVCSELRRCSRSAGNDGHDNPGTPQLGGIRFALAKDVQEGRPQRGWYCQAQSPSWMQADWLKPSD